MTPRLLTVTEAADALRVGRTTLYKMFADGDLAWVQIGAHRRVTTAEIDRFVQARKRGGIQEGPRVKPWMTCLGATST